MKKFSGAAGIIKHVAKRKEGRATELFSALLTMVIPTGIEPVFSA